MLNKVKPAAFLLVKTNSPAHAVLNSVSQYGLVVWGRMVYGPYQIVVYAEASVEEDLVEVIEKMRSIPGIPELDARVCKPLPEDDQLRPFQFTKPKSAVILINVDYKEEKERALVIQLRQLEAIGLARAMWGPTDIVAVAEASDDEAMRHLICDQVKMMKGVRGTTTLYCCPMFKTGKDMGFLEAIEPSPLP